MALPTIIVRDRKIILLSGYSKKARGEAKPGNDIRGRLTVCAEDKLFQVATQNPDAVAFGFIRGTWVASA